MVMPLVVIAVISVCIGVYVGIGRPMPLKFSGIGSNKICVIVYATMYHNIHTMILSHENRTIYVRVSGDKLNDDPRDYVGTPIVFNKERIGKKYSIFFVDKHKVNTTK